MRTTNTFWYSFPPSRAVARLLQENYAGEERKGEECGTVAVIYTHSLKHLGGKDPGREAGVCASYLWEGIEPSWGKGVWLL